MLQRSHRSSLQVLVGIIAFSCALSSGFAFAQPSVRYATYLGGAGNDGPGFVRVVSGFTYTAFEEATTQASDSNVRVVKFAPDTHAVVYSIAIGGTGRDIPAAIAVASDGAVWMTGRTTSIDFPRLNAIQTVNGNNTTAFLFRLSPDGVLTSSTLFAPDLITGTGSAGTKLALYDSAAIWAGWTCGDTVPTTSGAFQPQPAGGCDAFIATVSSTGTLLAATYLGGSGFDSINGIAIDFQVRIHVGGGTDSADLPTSAGVFQPTPGRRACGTATVPRPCRDGFVGRFSGDLRQRQYLTYLRETDPANTLLDSDDEVEDITVGGETIYATGYTHSGNLFPTTPHAYQKTCAICGANALNTGEAVGDMFVARIDALGRGLIFSTFVGGAQPSPTQGQVGRAIAVAGPDGPVFVAGYTTASDFPIVDGGATGNGFALRLNPSGSVLEYSTRFNGVAGDIALDRLHGFGPPWDTKLSGALWIAGTAGAELPTTPDAWHPQAAAGSDGFVAALAWPVVETDLTGSPNPPKSYSPLTISGWSIENAGTTDSGIDAVHIYAYPNSGAGAPLFLGVATLGLPSPDVANDFGPMFANARWSLTVDPLPPSTYLIAVFAHSRVTGRFQLTTGIRTLESIPRLLLDSPAPGAVVPFGTRVFVGGWAIDQAAPVAPGVDAVHVWIYPNGGAGAPFFAGAATYGINRPDVGAWLGARFTPSGYGLDVNGLAPGTYLIAVFAHSTFTDSFVAMQTRSVTVAAVDSRPRLSIDSPAPGAVVPVGTRVFVGGWAIDQGASAGTGIDAIHVWIYPNSGSGTPFFAGVAAYGTSRPDVGAIFGSRFTPSGYELDVNGLTPGTYLIAVFGHSTVTNSFGVMQTRSVTIQ